MSLEINPNDLQGDAMDIDNSAPSFPALTPQQTVQKKREKALIPCFLIPCLCGSNHLLADSNYVFFTII